LALCGLSKRKALVRFRHKPKIEFSASENTSARWICCQLGAREHYAVPRALHRYGALEHLLTDAWLGPKNVLNKLRPSLYTRFHANLATASVYAANVRSIAFELGAGFAGHSDWTRIIARNEWFQRIAVARLSRIESLCTVMAYSYAARKIFRLARERGWRTVLGQIDPGPFEERIVARLWDENSALLVGGSDRPPSQYWANWREECAIADRIVVNSLWSQSALIAEGVPAEKIKLVPLAYEGPRTSALSQRGYPGTFSQSRRLRVLFLGLINLRKGIGPLLRAIRLLRGAPVEFWFVGQIQITIPADLRDNPQVRWFGPVSSEDTAQFYRNADVFIFPTFSDGFGLTQLEAQAWRLPIIATKFCGDVVKDDISGWLLSELTPNSIAAVIQRCLAEPRRLEEFSANAVRKRFGLEEVGKQWLRIFE
jgi:glycosyltransferase involved in cell wall biosynthesis